MTYPSIFNDVLGPVMRGPSSSHCAAALRIGRLCRDLVNANFHDILIEFDPSGSLATTHKGQGSDMGLFGGFLGWDAHDERLLNYESDIAETGWQIHIAKRPINASHPNTYQMTFTTPEEVRRLTAISTGGGMIEIIEIDGVEVSLLGDGYVALIYVDHASTFEKFLETNLPKHGEILCEDHASFIQVKSCKPFSSSWVSEVQSHHNVHFVRILNPVLPILSIPGSSVPFSTAEELLVYTDENKVSLAEAALHYEAARGQLSRNIVRQKMAALLHIMKDSIQSGLAGTQYHDRILGSQSLQFKRKMSEGALVKGDVLNEIILYVSAMMEIKSSMGVIVAAPTAGACGVVPGVILGAGSALGLSEEILNDGLLTAGIVGVFIAHQASFAAEVGGCQAECGSGSSMAAAGLVTMMGGNINQALSAASQALQNSLGMICDPIANRVEAPCLGKNVMAASNALSCANMALSDYDHLIPLDQVIQTMARVSKQMARELRCTSLGGLAITDAAKAIEARLADGSKSDLEHSLAEASQRFKIC